MRRVGILGGMGPQATVLLMQKVIAASPAQDDADHVPLIVDQNPQVPSRIRRLIEGTGEDPAPVLAAMARRLKGQGPRRWPCPATPRTISRMRSGRHRSVPFLDMVALSVAKARRSRGGGFGRHPRLARGAPRGSFRRAHGGGGADRRSTRPTRTRRLAPSARSRRMARPRPRARRSGPRRGTCSHAAHASRWSPAPNSR